MIRPEELSIFGPTMEERIDAAIRSAFLAREWPAVINVRNDSPAVVAYAIASYRAVGWPVTKDALDNVRIYLPGMVMS